MNLPVTSVAERHAHPAGMYHISSSMALFSCCRLPQASQNGTLRCASASANINNSPCTQKCDGNKPKCNQCLRFNRVEECEFSEVSVPSTARVLEQHIARLQSRIQELEQDDPDAIRLHDPHAAYRQTETATSRSGQEWWDMPEPPPQVARDL